MTKTVVLVLFGGRSAEHEISLLSARFVIRSLDRTRFELLAVGIDKRGVWRLLDERDLPASADPRENRVNESARRAWLLATPSTSGRGTLEVEGGEAREFDIVFPVMHGPLGEDGAVQGLFELAGVAYVGSGVAASAVGMDKVLQKRVLGNAGVNVVRCVSFGRGELDRRGAELRAECEALGFPMFVKPANMGSSLGVSRVMGPSGLEAAIDEAFRFDTTVLLEAGVRGCREIEVSVLGNEGAEASVAGEIVVVHADGFYSYDAKYLAADGARLMVPAPLDEELARRIRRTALEAYAALGCAGLARVDFFVSGSDVYVNELNTMPGFTAISMYPRLWEASGVDGPQLVTRLLELGLERHAARTKLATSR
ncbi:MAG: D-alanine--D-alanine ligase [Myxococcales bacterium]|nr:D-alanine--D-alanine ligase [Myxococcales bacterium]